MPKIPDFSKFDIQGIVNSVKSMINPDIKVPEGDFIGARIVEVTKLIQNVSSLHVQAEKDLNKVNDLLNMLYRELEAFRKQVLEQQQAQASGSTSGTTTASSSATTQAPSNEPTEVPKSTTKDTSASKVSEKTSAEDITSAESETKKSSEKDEG